MADGALSRGALLTVGHIDVRETFGRFGARHSHLPLMPWQRLFEVMSEVDVNLAPLERRNPFTECKSSIKYLEAALVGVPTIATPLSDFQRVIESERNGCLADSKEAWRDGLRQLVESPSLREALGARALEDAIAHHTTSSAAPELFEKLTALRSRGTTDRALTINWVVRAPIAGTGGGYWTIFRLANGLADAGHHVRVYVEPVAHLDGMSEAEIHAFLEEHFGPLRVEVVIGHDQIQPADASIATNWPTAYTVTKLPGRCAASTSCRTTSPSSTTTATRCTARPPPPTTCHCRSSASDARWRGAWRRRHSVRPRGSTSRSTRPSSG